MEFAALVRKLELSDGCELIGVENYPTGGEGQHESILAGSRGQGFNRELHKRFA